MKVFISSLITGFEPFRSAARRAIQDLGHEAVMAENFGARPTSPQVACLDGVRQSGLVILILGEAYGAKQASGLSATHEEYREAKQTHPVIAFVQEGVTRDPEEDAFVTEVQGWSGGLFRGGFKTAEALHSGIVGAIHQFELSRAAGPVDEQALLKQALDLLPRDRRGYSRSDQYLSLSIVSGPAQPVLRPSQIEAADLTEYLEQASLFGATQIFSRVKGVQHRMSDGNLVLHQDGETSMTLSPQGSLLFTLPVPRSGDAFSGVVEEDIADLMTSALRYAVKLFDHIDATQRLTHVALAVALSEAQFLVWRTRAEQPKNGGAISMGYNQEQKPVHLSPAVRPRAALAHDTQALVEDIVTLLRRQYRANR